MEVLKHECGLGLIRLRKDPEYYHEKYGSCLWGLRKMYLLMEKQLNRGQDGAGLASVKLNIPPGQTYLARERIFEPIPPWPNLVKKIEDQYTGIFGTQFNPTPSEIYNKFPFAGELLIGHVRYGTYGNNSLESCHPVIRLNNWKTRTLVMAGNFNLTNVDDQFQKLLELGQHPRDKSDTVTALERIGHFLDVSVQNLFNQFKSIDLSNIEISDKIAAELPTLEILRRSAKYWDGGYVMGGLIGHGEMFVIRDPWAIRPAYYYIDDEIIVVASERGAIVSAFSLEMDDVYEFPAAHALIVKPDNNYSISPLSEPQKKSSCSFERIYFSKANDPDIYNERKNLGHFLVNQVLKSVDYDLENTLFSYVPNSAIVAYRGLIDGLQQYAYEKNINTKIRAEHIVWKDSSLRTFITNDDIRKNLVSSVYNVTYGVVKKGIDNLVVVDDSVVRGTTIKESLLKILALLSPKKIIIASSSPQIRYPDCYGIDMSNLGQFVAFQSTIELLKSSGKISLIDEVYQMCLDNQHKDTFSEINFVKNIYKPFSEEEISRQISKDLYTPELGTEVEIIFQKVQNLKKAIPGHTGDWYFTGDYPTPGGYKVVNQSFINYVEKISGRSY